MRNALIFMTRVPIPGKTKTRLEPFLTPEQCAALHTAFIKDIYYTLKAVNADIIGSYTPEKHKATLQSILGEKVELTPQIQGGLGERMYQSISDCFAQGYDRCILIGSDIPTISAEVINGAFASLENKDIVIGPTEDGGYYLIGMKKPFKEVFDNKFYGVKTVYRAALESINNAGLSYSEVQRCYDIDVFEDLLLMLERCNELENIPYNTLCCLKELGILSKEMGRKVDAYGTDA
jgi:uncharacterized protein